MAVLTSRMAAAIDALVAIASSADALTGVLVIDGPIDTSSEETADAGRRLFIGTNQPDGSVESLAVEGDQSFRTIGARTRDEAFQLHCLAEGWNGDGDMKAARDAAVAILAAVETAIRATDDAPDAYNLAGAVSWAGIGGESISQQYIDQGAYARVDFTLSCRANLY